jgi:hypothetical protein
MQSQVFNNGIGSPYDMDFPKLTNEQENLIVAGLFEQLLLFDKIILSTNRTSFPLVFLISKLGINTVERLIENGYIKFMLWTPVIVTSTGRGREDGSIDESVIYGTPPITAGAYANLDPEENISIALSHFNFNRDRKRILTRLALKQYIVPDGMTFSTRSAELIIDAYKHDNLKELGLPYIKEPDQLNPNERIELIKLGHVVIETAIVSKYNFKSYENFERFEICKQNLTNIGKAYNISENTANIFKLEGLPDLKALYLSERLDFDSVFTIRHLSNAKYFRKWINEIGESSNVQELTREYLNEIKGNTKFFDSVGGKFLKTLGMLGANTILGSLLPGITLGSMTAAFGLGLLDTFLLESILKGKNPSMFIENINKEMKNKILD